MNTKYNNMMLCITIAICFIVVLSFSGYGPIESINKKVENFQNHQGVYQTKDELICKIIK